ncbi:MAG: hypothetical protein N2745_03120 [Syntrophorhabdaceae bacterium]|nr:hypothetical protein [Syntrophorhabdaceae bacterium]
MKLMIPGHLFDEPSTAIVLKDDKGVVGAGSEPVPTVITSSVITKMA